MDNKAQILNYFVTQVVDGWMLTDIVRLTSIPHRSGAPGNCNFPIALYVFACIEFLGQLTPVTPINPRQPGHTQTSIMGFIDDFFPDDFKQKLRPHRSNFVNIFRNGLAHNYFAKAAGISRTKPDYFSVENGHLVLDADRFAEAFKLATDKLKENIKTDPQLVERMVNRYDAQHHHNLQFRVAPATTLTHTTHSSGPSLAHPSMTSGLTSSSPSTPATVSGDLSKITTTLPPPPVVKQDNNDKSN